MSVSVEEALQLIYEHAEVVSQELIPIELALGRIVATDITATHNLPPFDNSAMDGYAVIAADTLNASQQSPVLLKVIGDVPAGATSSKKLL